MEAIDFANFDAAVSTQRWRLPTSRDAGCMSSGDRLTEKTERAGASVRQDLYRPPGGASSRYAALRHPVARAAAILPRYQFAHPGTTAPPRGRIVATAGIDHKDRGRPAPALTVATPRGGRSSGRSMLPAAPGASRRIAARETRNYM